MANDKGFVMNFPAFIPEDPQFWMDQMELAFFVNGIHCMSRRYTYLISALDRNASKEVRDLIQNASVTAKKCTRSDAYEEEKKKLLQRLQAPSTRRLLEREQMGKRTPSQFLRHLISVAGPKADDNVIKTQFIAKFPSEIQDILRNVMYKSIDSFGIFADLVVDIAANEAATAPAANRQPRQQGASLKRSRMTEDEEPAKKQTILLKRVDAMRIQIDKFVSSMNDQIAKFASSMNDQMEEMRLAIIGLQNADQKEITNLD